ncbi:hypothetical protein SDC9_122744 [bioreactor metagenome]|uniref:Uncharacterized protein n=1 Tax=bioreactor metagenome TaxID=1076179 RepID=A0A645CFP2_9ZZZZ
MQGAGQPAATCVGFTPGAAQLAVDDGQPLGIDLSSALDEGQRRQRRVIGFVLGQILVVDAEGHVISWLCKSTPAFVYRVTI